MNSFYPLLRTPLDKSPRCIIQGIIGSYFSLVAMFTSSVIVLIIYRIFFPKDGTPSTSFTVTVSYRGIAFAWGLPVAFALMPLVTNSYGLDEDDA